MLSRMVGLGGGQQQQLAIARLMGRLNYSY